MELKGGIIVGIKPDPRVTSDLTGEWCVLRLGLVGVRSKEDTPSDLIASRLWEAALIFEIMKYGYKETRNR